MRRYIYIIFILLTASSCVQRVEDIRPVYGSLSVELKTEVEVDALTKAEVPSDIASYTLYLSGQSTGNDPYAAEFLYADMAESYAVPYGIYSVAAENCTVTEAESANDGLGCARYYGITSGIQVKSPEAVPVTVSCEMVNSRASVVFEQSFLDDFESVRAELSVSTRTIGFDPSNADTRVGYYNVDQNSVLNYTVYGTIDGVELSYTSSMPFRPAKHVKVTFRSNHNGILNPGVTVDGTVGTVEISGVIDPDSGNEVTGGSIEIPVIYVDYAVNDVVVVDCIIDVLD